MSNKPLKAEQVREILRLHLQNRSNREIARLLDPPVFRGTVNRYVDFIRTNRLDVGLLLRMDDAELDKVFHKGNPAYTEPKMDTFIKDIPYLEVERMQEGMSVLRMWINHIKRSSGPHYGFTQFRFHLMQCGLLPPTRLELPRKGGGWGAAILTTRSFETSHVDTETGEVGMVHYIVLYMLSSGYARLSRTQSYEISHTVESVNELLNELGGSPKAVEIKDLIKVCRRDRPCDKTTDKSRTVKSALEGMASYYLSDGPIGEGEIKAARSRMEKLFNHLRHWLEKTTAESRTEEDVVSAVSLFQERYNRTRVRGLELSREESFLRNERPLLSALPEMPYEVGDITDHQVNVDGTIQVGKGDETGYYSVPVAYIGTCVHCLRGPRHALILDEKKAPITAHQWVSGHQYSLKEEHIEEWEKSDYGNLDTFVHMAFNLSPNISYWVRGFFDRALKSGLHKQECVRKYQNIEWLVNENGNGLVSDFCVERMRNNQYEYAGFTRDFHRFLDSRVKEGLLRDMTPKRK